MTRLDYLLKQHDALIGWYKQSEEKAKFLVTVNTLAVGIVNGLVFIGADKVKPIRPLYTGPVLTLLTLCGMALIVSYLFVFRTMWPRQHSHKFAQKPSERLWFFGDIRSMSREEHRRAVADWSSDGFEETLTSQNFILSESVWDKHQSINWAIAATILALVLLFGLGVAYAYAVADMPPSQPLQALQGGCALREGAVRWTAEQMCLSGYVDGSRRLPT